MVSRSNASKPQSVLTDSNTPSFTSIFKNTMAAIRTLIFRQSKCVCAYGREEQRFPTHAGWLPTVFSFVWPPLRCSERLRRRKIWFRHFNNSLTSLTQSNRRHGWREQYEPAKPSHVVAKMKETKIAMVMPFLVDDAKQCFVDVRSTFNTRSVTKLFIHSINLMKYLLCHEGSQVR